MCLACLDDEKCWVCLGQGLIDEGRGTIKPCHRCYGSGRCFKCQPIPLGEVGHAPAVEVERNWWSPRRKGS
jgi:hypothetical protein